MKQPNARTREELRLAVREGFRPNYIFFWGHKPLPSGDIGSCCFSQWWPSAFNVDGIEYPTAEHYMMAEKARLFGDEVTRKEILAVKDPNAARQLGRNVNGFEEDVWIDSRLPIVVRGSYEKFTQNAELRRFLLQTGNKVLVEASPMDRIWGIGLRSNDTRARNPELWPGLNLLGFALMEVRQRLIEA